MVSSFNDDLAKVSIVLENDEKIDSHDITVEPSHPGLLPQYICKNSKLSEPVVCSAELIRTGLWAAWAEQHAPYSISTDSEPGRNLMYQS